MSYRVKRKRITRINGGDYIHFEPGDEIEPRECELKSFGDNLVKVESDGSEASEEEETTESEEQTESDSDESEPSESESDYSRDYPDLSEMTVTEELPEYLKSHDFSEEEKEELHDIESEGDNRITAHQRIDEYA